MIKRDIAAPFQPKSPSLNKDPQIFQEEIPSTPHSTPLTPSPCPSPSPLPLSPITTPISSNTSSAYFTPLSSSSHKNYTNFNFLPLEPIETLLHSVYCGPTIESNWVIPGKLLVGAFPASRLDDETYHLLTSILAQKVTKFVCLQLEYTPGVSEELWRNGEALRPYFEDVLYILDNKDKFMNLSHITLNKEDAKFQLCPILDCGIGDDEKILELCEELVNDIANGEVIYLHCWGGHGRTGTVVSIMLHLMYGLNPIEAMKRCQAVHDLRQYYIDVGSPQTNTQRMQVARVINYLIEKRKLELREEERKKLTNSELDSNENNDHEEREKNLIKLSSFLLKADSSRTSGPVNHSLYASLVTPTSQSFYGIPSQQSSTSNTKNIDQSRKMKSLNSISDYINSNVTFNSGCSLPKVNSTSTSTSFVSSSEVSSTYISPLSNKVVEKSTSPSAFPNISHGKIDNQQILQQQQQQHEFYMEVESEDEGIVYMNVESVLDDLTYVNNKEKDNRSETPNPNLVIDLEESLNCQMKLSKDQINGYNEDNDLQTNLKDDDQREAEIVSNTKSTNYLYAPSPPVSTPPPSHKSLLSNRKVE